MDEECRFKADVANEHSRGFARYLYVRHEVRVIPSFEGVRVEIGKGRPRSILRMTSRLTREFAVCLLKAAAKSEDKKAQTWKQQPDLAVLEWRRENPELATALVELMAEEK